MSDMAEYADATLLEDRCTAHLVFRAAEFSDDPEILDGLAREKVTIGVLRKIAHNPATAEHTLAHLIETDERSLTYAVTHRTDVSAEFLDRIARGLTDSTAIFHAASAPNASEETLRYLVEHPSAPPVTADIAAPRLGLAPIAA